MGLSNVSASRQRRADGKLLPEFLDNGHDLRVNLTVRGNKVRGGWIERLAVHPGHSSPCLFDNQCTRRDVPGFQVLLPERLETAGGDVTEVERSRTEPTHRPRTAEEQAEQLHEVSIVVVHAVWETGHEQRVEEDIGAGHSNCLPVQIRALSAFGREEFLARWIVDSS